VSTITGASTPPTALTAERLRADAALPPDLAPSPTPSDSPDVFLTGASGFVGAELLRTVLARSPARVYCHLRARSADDGRERLLRGLAASGDVPRDWRDRVIAVPGDLTRPRLGIAERQWDEIAANAGEIVHAGALVNHVAPYALFRRPNVLASHEILRLSAARAQKRIHHVSSLGYWSGYRPVADRIADDARNVAGPGITAPGYLLSKWVSDRLMEQASDRGFPVAIYRLGYIGAGWHGAHNQRGWLELHLRAFARLGLMPEGDSCLALTPVDLLAGDVWDLSRRGDAFGRAYNMAYREQPITMADVEAAFADIGSPVRRVPGAAWYAAFCAAPQDPYMQLLNVFLQESPPVWDAARHALHQRLSAPTAARLGNPAAFSIPHYLQAMLSGLVRSERVLAECADRLAA
jgi:thioester reductase-like protein